MGSSASADEPVNSTAAATVATWQWDGVIERVIGRVTDERVALSQSGSLRTTVAESNLGRALSVLGCTLAPPYVLTDDACIEVPMGAYSSPDDPVKCGKKHLILSG